MSDAGAQSNIVGHCLCKSVTITVDNPKDDVEICHCDMCRRWGGGFYAALTGDCCGIDGDQFITAYQSSDWAERAFCKQCGSNLWYRFLPTGNRSFHAGLFSDADRFTIGKEIFTDERAEWSDISGDHPKQTGVEVIAEAKAAGLTFD